ncbi:ABC copper transporter ATPase NosF [Shewanella colwelliana]|uniref:ABC transporter ATP-binding protein n=1 Tax=Shewanella colwelliana TaxID=23 RepID=UPI001BBA2285|nr:ABC transporter ATP-binding protein [Shewanella colwelliana]GIU19856.1 ABC copper transporter ATPase NosF [Shewanella colwelliana]
MSELEPAVRLAGVSHHFAEQRVLHDVELVLARGTTLALLGHNGAGKSTLMKMILGLISPAQGQVEVLGQRLQCGERPTSIGYLPENINFYDKLTGHEVLSYFAALKGERSTRVSQLIEEFGLGYAQHKPVKSYSKGMKQRLGFAQAIIAQPKLLLLDEPTVGLDPQASQFLYSKVNQLRDQGCAVIICTHELNLVEPHLDVAMMLGRGRCLAFGSLAQLLAQSELGVQITFNAIESVVSKHTPLAEFYHQGDLRCSISQRAWLIQYLTRECGIFDFDIKNPCLADIYNEKMTQMQSCNEQGLSFTSSISYSSNWSLNNVTP